MTAQTTKRKLTKDEKKRATKLNGLWEGLNRERGSVRSTGSGPLGFCGDKRRVRGIQLRSVKDWYSPSQGGPGNACQVTKGRGENNDSRTSGRARAPPTLVNDPKSRLLSDDRDDAEKSRNCFGTHPITTVRHFDFPHSDVQWPHSPPWFYW